MAKTVELDIPHDAAERERRQRNFLVGKEAELLAEIERLRAALQQIKKRGDDEPGTSRNDYDAGYKAGTEQCAFIAEEALGVHEQ